MYTRSKNPELIKIRDKTQGDEVAKAHAMLCDYFRDLNPQLGIFNNKNRSQNIQLFFEKKTLNNEPLDTVEKLIVAAKAIAPLYCHRLNEYLNVISRHVQNHLAANPIKIDSEENDKLPEYASWLNNHLKEINAEKDPYKKECHQMAFITVHNLFGKKLKEKTLSRAEIIAWEDKKLEQIGKIKDPEQHEAELVALGYTIKHMP